MGLNRLSQNRTVSGEQTWSVLDLFLKQGFITSVTVFANMMLFFNESSYLSISASHYTRSCGFFITKSWRMKVIKVPIVGKTSGINKNLSVPQNEAPFVNSK